MASMVMAEVVRWLPWKDAACSKTAAEMADLLKIRPADVTQSLKTLEEVGAIKRVPRGRTKLIYVNPEGACRGPIDQHASAVDRYRAEVVDLADHRPAG
jgi:predicted ArsR family transcriptional regulator